MANSLGSRFKIGAKDFNAGVYIRETENDVQTREDIVFTDDIFQKFGLGRNAQKRNEIIEVRLQSSGTVLHCRAMDMQVEEPVLDYMEYSTGFMRNDKPMRVPIRQNPREIRLRLLIEDEFHYPSQGGLQFAAMGNELQLARENERTAKAMLAKGKGAQKTINEQADALAKQADLIAALEGACMDYEAQLAVMLETKANALPAVEDCYSPATKFMFKLLVEILFSVAENYF